GSGGAGRHPGGGWGDGGADSAHPDVLSKTKTGSGPGNRAASIFILQKTGFVGIFCFTNRVSCDMLR
ncbi:MAG: hypothetical protein K2K53_13765, partial [Oscillospiraceae bacterium]|nr:hypothetical protein [Oscillospiraceae bacterium]